MGLTRLKSSVGRAAFFSVGFKGESSYLSQLLEVFHIPSSQLAIMGQDLLYCFPKIFVSIFGPPR
jgi:hypothetical protein